MRLGDEALGDALACGLFQEFVDEGLVGLESEKQDGELNSPLQKPGHFPQRLKPD
jgi:hypothetical protein